MRLLRAPGMCLCVLFLSAASPGAAFARGGGHGGGHGGGRGGGPGGGFHAGGWGGSYAGGGWRGGGGWGVPGAAVRPLWTGGFWGWRGVPIWIGIDAVTAYDGWAWMQPQWVWNGTQWVWQDGYWAPVR
jgi:hypothetical protein